MLSDIQRNILVRALRIRKEQGQNLEEILAGYTKLTEEEKVEVLEAVDTKGTRSERLFPLLLGDGPSGRTGGKGRL